MFLCFDFVEFLIYNIQTCVYYIYTYILYIYIPTYKRTYIHTYVYVCDYQYIRRFGHRAVFVNDTNEILMYGGMAYQVDQPLALVCMYVCIYYIYTAHTYV